MRLDLSKITEIYGRGAIYLLKNNLKNIEDNMNYLVKLDFDNIYDIVQTVPYLFLISPSEFREKIDNLIQKLGVHYKELLEENKEYWDEL